MVDKPAFSKPSHNHRADAIDKQDIENYKFNCHVYIIAKYVNISENVKEGTLLFTRSRTMRQFASLAPAGQDAGQPQIQPGKRCPNWEAVVDMVFDGDEPGCSGQVSMVSFYEQQTTG